MSQILQNVSVKKTEKQICRFLMVLCRFRVFKAIGSAYLICGACGRFAERCARRASLSLGPRAFLRIMSGSPNCRVLEETRSLTLFVKLFPYGNYEAKGGELYSTHVRSDTQLTYLLAMGLPCVSDLIFFFLLFFFRIRQFGCCPAY